MQRLKTVALFLVDALAKTMLFCGFFLSALVFAQEPPSGGNSTPPPPNGGFVRDVPDVGIDNYFGLMLAVLCGFLLLKKKRLFQQKASNHSILKQQ